MEAIYIPLIVAVIEALKQAGAPKRYLPLISLVIGIAVVTVSDGLLTTNSVLQGAILGLSASGLYSGAKSVIGK